MAGVSTWSHFSHSTKPNIRLDLPLQYLVRYSVSRLVLFPYLHHHLMPQTRHPGPRELQPCQKKISEMRTALGQTDSAWHRWCHPGWWWQHLEGGLCWTLIDTGALPWVWRGNNRRAGFLLPGPVNALRTAGGGAVTPHTLFILEEILWRIMSRGKRRRRVNQDVTSHIAPHPAKI